MSTRNKQPAKNETKQAESRTPENKERQEIRQRMRKPLKLDVTGIQKALEADKGEQVKLKWVRHQAVSYHQDIGWNVVSSSMKTQINMYSPDGRLKAKSENIQDDTGGAYTAEVGNGEFNFLMWKDLERYEAEDAVWSKEEADRPMDSIQSAAETGERAGLGGDVKAYQPKQQVKINKQRDAY